jgi:hypothetical protein
MYFKYQDLISSIGNDDKKIKNFFDTFGFVVIRGAVNKSDFKKLLREYDDQYIKRSGELTPWKMLLNRLGFSGEKRYGFRQVARAVLRRGGMRFLPNFVDGSEIYTDYFLNSAWKSIYTYFAGENWLYLGSDGSNFITTSFPWHRDWFTKIPLLKFNFYFNPLPFIGGKFLIIPGSNFANDAYSQLIQKTMSWPMQNKVPGGLSENGRIPKIRNPRNIFSRICDDEYEVPHVQLKLNKGDLVIFDHRAVHCVQNNFPKFQRRLLTVLLSKNAYDFDDNHYAFQHSTKEELMTEIVDLIVNERNHIGCPPYGNALLNSDFTKSNHYINIEANSGSEKYNSGTFILKNGFKFQSVLDFKKYATIGENYRQYFNQQNESFNYSQDKNAQDYSYADVHLGINAQNISKIES